MTRRPERPTVTRNANQRQEDRVVNEQITQLSRVLLCAR